MSEGYYNKADLQNAEYIMVRASSRSYDPEVKEKYSEIIKKIKLVRVETEKKYIAFSITALLIIAGYFAITYIFSERYKWLGRC